MDELTVKLTEEAREALDALLEEDDWDNASEAVSGALEALVVVRAAKSETFAAKMAKRSVQVQAQKMLDAVRQSEPERTVREVILEYVVGEEVWDEVVEELVEWPFTATSWQEVSDARFRGWISTAQYWDLSGRVRGLGPGAVV